MACDCLSHFLGLQLSQPTRKKLENTVIGQTSPSPSEDTDFDKKLKEDANRNALGQLNLKGAFCNVYRAIFFSAVSLTIVAVALVAWEMYRLGYELHVVAWFVSGVCVFFTVPISLSGILNHLKHYRNPMQQAYIVRILWMPPIFAIDAWLSLRYKDSAKYLSLIRECYEAFVIYNFTFYLIALVAESQEALISMLEKKEMHHLMPFCCLPKWKMGSSFLRRIKFGVLQFTIVRAVLAIITFFLELDDKYDEGHFSPNRGYVYIICLVNLSQIWAMYCLIVFYHTMHEELKVHDPLPKFLCIKLVVFFSFWQGIIIAILVKVNVITADPGWHEYKIHHVATGLQNFIICLEMFFAAVAHVKFFPYDTYYLSDEERRHRNYIAKITDMLDVTDVTVDILGIVRSTDAASHTNNRSHRIRNAFLVVIIITAVVVGAVFLVRLRGTQDTAV